MIMAVSASCVVDRNMLEYMKHVAYNRLPNDIDGLKRGTRRALWVLKDTFEGVKANTIVGKTMEYHVVGDASIYETIIRLCHNFVFGIPLVNSEGNSGFYTNPTPSQMRYVGLYLSNFARDVFFNTIQVFSTKNDVIPFIIVRFFVF